MVDMEMLRKLANHFSTIRILWPVKAIFEKGVATVEVDTFISQDHVQTVTSHVIDRHCEVQQHYFNDQAEILAI